MFRSIIYFILVFLLIGIYSCGNQPKRIKKLKNDLVGYELKSTYGDCTVLSDEIDLLTGIRKTDLIPERLFSYTHPKLKEFFPDAPFLECYGNLSKLDKKDYLLNLQFVFNSDNLRSSYNGLDEDSALRITLINGEKTYLNNIIQDNGIKDELGKIIFQGLYPISKSDIRAFQKYEIAYIGVIWPGGFETYNVHAIDFLMRQLACLERI